MGLQRTFLHDETVDGSEIQLSNCESFERKTDLSNYQGYLPCISHIVGIDLFAIDLPYIYHTFDVGLTYV